MQSSPQGKPLYRTLHHAVICAVLACAVSLIAAAQVYRAPARSKGPRATALLQLSGNRGRIIPIVMMLDGKFYDASVYRADPRPWALDPGTVYEAFRNGASVGLFVVGAAQEPAGTWYGLGEWKPAGAEVAEKKTAPPPKPSSVEDERPILRKHGSSTTPPPSTSPPPNQQPAASAPAAPPPSAPSRSADDSDRPVLRRGKPPASTRTEEDFPPVLTSTKPAAAGKSPSLGKPATTAAPTVELLPAISDAGGPEPRPYTYEFKPGEQAQVTKKLQAFARAELAKWEQTRQPDFLSASLEPAAFRAFDLDLSNQPVFVLSAPAKVTFGARPARPRTGRTRAAVPARQEDAYVTVVAHVDIYGELHQVFSSVTDGRHLDQIPRLDLIDAVDVDGDSRGELLFRETTDSATAWAIYRLLPDRLSKLFDTAGPAD